MTGIIIITYNIDSRIFVLQMEAIKRFCQDKYQIEIIDNSRDPERTTAIKYHSEIRGINYRKTEAATMDSSKSHSFAANLSLSLLKDKYDTFFYLDHDCIPVADFSCERIINSAILMAGLRQDKKKNYFWPGCFMFSGQIAGRVDFSTNEHFGLDTGGNTYKLIEKYGEDTCVFFTESYMENPEYHGKQNYFSIIGGLFYHCIGASNWFKLKDNHGRINAFINVVTRKMEENKIS